MKLVIQLTAETEVPEDFQLTPQNYSSIKVRFDSQPMVIRQAALHLKKDKAKKAKGATK